MKIIQYILGMVLLFSTINVFAQHNLSGTVTDKLTGNGLAGISVYFPDLKTGAITDASGVYRFHNLKKGFYLLEVTGSGYRSDARRIYLPVDSVVDISLEQSATELHEVIVTGVTRSTELKRNPVIVKTVDRNTFNQNSSTNLIDALKSVPGVSEISTGPAISKPVIRGMGYNRVITLNNGMRQEGQQWGDEHGIEIDEYSVDRVEIIKGPGSLMYGSDGIAGVLNFLSPRPPLEGDIKTQLVTNYQSTNSLLGYSLSNAGNENGFQWLGRFSNKYAGNYENKYDGKVYNSGFKEYDGTLSIGLNKKWGHSILTVNSYNTKLGIVEGERDEKGRFTYENEEGEEVTATPGELKGYHISIPYQRISHLSFASNNYFILGKGTMNADLGFQNNRRREFEEAENPDEVGLYLSLSTFNYNIRYNLQKINGWESSVGIGGMQQTNVNRGEEFLIPGYNLFDIGAFVYTQKTCEKLTIAGGLRFDNRNMKANELYLDADEHPVTIPGADDELKFGHFNRNFNGISGSAGLSYQASRNATVKLNLSQGFRAPNVAELASNGKHEGTFRYEIGNPDLKTEVSHQIDLAYYYTTDHLTLEISPFVNFISNYSYLEKLRSGGGQDSIPDPSDPAPAFKYTSGSAILAGGEFYMDIHPHPLDWLHIENAFSLVQATQDHQPDSMRYLPFIPAPHYKGGIKVEFDNLTKAVSNFYVKMNIDHYFRKSHVYSAFDTETATPDYTLLSAGVGGSIKAFGKKDFINLFVSGNNLANVAYQSHMSRLKYASENPLTGRIGVFDAGRNISIKMILSI